MFCDRVCIWCFILFLPLIKDIIAQQLTPPATDFNKHSLVQPRVHHARTKREISSTRDMNGEHHPEVMISLEVDGEEYVLDLRLNHDLITDNHVITYQEGGRTVVHKPKKEEVDLCQYSGTVKGKPHSRVAVSTCHGLKGVIFEDNRTKYIEPAQGDDIKSLHYIYDNSDYNSNYRCGNEGGTARHGSQNASQLNEYESEELQHLGANRYKRQSESWLHEPYNANARSRYVELVLVVDNAVFNQISGNRNTPLNLRKRKVYTEMQDIANVINSVYSPLNIFVVLVGVEIWNDADKIYLDNSSDRTLDNFVAYRRNKLVYINHNDNAHLITGRKFNDNIVGKAYTKVMCMKQSSAGIAYFHSNVSATFALTIAHEMGHNFGMDHDSPECECPESQKCIMYPTTLNDVRHFSSCSLKSLALTFDQGYDLCLRNKPSRLFGSPTCGNGFVEAGEQCDCGLVERTLCSACCHADTCLLRHNATCGAGTCCDLQTCRPRPAGSECRAAERECDLPEYCSGRSEYCPPDVHKMDTTPCGNNNDAYCYRGSCRSRADQCRLLWGVAAHSCRDTVYKMANTKGTEYGHCGYSSNVPKTYKACSERDALCGSLQCLQLDSLQYGKTVDSTLRYNSDIYNNTIKYCTIVQIDLGLDEIDAGMVPDGAACGENKMCLNQKCVSVERVRASGRTCPDDCSGHGICNSKGQCHCESGFAPPRCDQPGVGGSLHSGPAGDPAVQHIFMVVMYIIFLGVVPLCFVALLATHYWRYLLRRPHKPYVPSGGPLPGGPHPGGPRPGATLLQRLLACTRASAPPPPTSDYQYETKDNIQIQKTNIHKDILTPPKTNNRLQTINELEKKNTDINNDKYTIKYFKVRPSVKPKPTLNSSKENRPKVVIVKQGLTSTTNELIANINQINMLNNVRNINIHENARLHHMVPKIKK